MKKLVAALFLIFTSASIYSQNKTLSNKDIWAGKDLVPNYVKGFKSMKDGERFTRIHENKKDQITRIIAYNFKDTFENAVLFNNTDIFIETGDRIPVNDYAFSEDETKILIYNDYKQIYRHSYSSMAYVYDLTAKKLIKIDNDRVMYPTFSPDGTKVAYVKNNNLYYRSLSASESVAVTKDGEINKILNGKVDWVYEEEFSMSKGFEWSPDGSYIAYYRFDESKVKEFTMDMYWNEIYPTYETFKYPKAGEANSKVDVCIFSLAKATSVVCKTGSENDQYLPRIGWTTIDGKLSIQRLNRHQNHWEILFADANSGEVETIYEEKSKYYVEINNNVKFLKDKSSFVYTSEKSGFNHIHLYNFVKKTDRQLTSGNWEVESFLGMDEASGTIYILHSQGNVSERILASLNIKSGKITNLSTQKGWHSVVFSGSYKYYVDNYSTMTQPSTVSVFDSKGKFVRELLNNKDLEKKLSGYNLGKVEFGSMAINTDSDLQLNYWMIKPPGFDAGKKYPVLMYVYGGPGHQTVINSWGGNNYLWYQMMAQKGYIIVSVDNRGTGSRGEAFKKSTYLNLGKLELEDQTAAAKWLGNLPYVDKSRIGIWGWSFGGYMSSLCISKSADVFKMAIAVAPVTDWRFYDNIYTERYLRTPQENPNGYKDNSPINFVSGIKGKYLIVHGTADDNVHFQNAVEMVNAMVKNNIPFDSEYYPNKNHGISGGFTRLHLFEKITDFTLSNL